MDQASTSSRVDWGRPRKLTFEQARQEQRDEAASMSVQQRLRAMRELNCRAFVIAPEQAHDPEAAIFVRRPLSAKSDLIANKQQVGRPRDLVDADELLRIPDPNPDPKPVMP